MSDYELGSLFVDFLNTANFVFSNYMVLIFGMVTASYLLAHRMGRWVAILFLMLYSIVAIMVGMGVYFAFSDFYALGQHIHEVAQTGEHQLDWLGPAGPSGANMPRMSILTAVFVGTTYIGSITFFFVVRYKRLHVDSNEKSVGKDTDAL